MIFKFRNWLSLKLVSMASSLNTNAVVAVYYFPDSNVHNFTYVFRGSKIGASAQKPDIEVYFDGVRIK